MKLIVLMTLAPPCALLALFALTQLFGDVSEPSVWLALFGAMALTGLLVLLYLLCRLLGGATLAGYEKAAAALAAFDLFAPLALLALVIYSLRHMKLIML
ncbi:MAG TPA: hypothetical protein VF546_00605 [Pyrinomonadaceae bacterium]|jgi:prepilin signal peptidase PulO-like enzyme (type II secretory pathway)